MAENTDTDTSAPAASDPAPAAPAAEPAADGGWKAQVVTEPELKEIPRPEKEEPAPSSEPDSEDAGDSDDDGDGYVASSGGASYASDIAMMRAEAGYTDNTVIAHYELLISQAEKAGNGPKTIQALKAGLESARTALGASRDAITAVASTSEPVQAAYDDAGGEAADDKDYFHGD